MKTCKGDGKSTEISSLLKGALTESASDAQTLVVLEVPLLLTAILRAVRELNVPVRWGKNLAPTIDGETRSREDDA